MCDKLAPKDIIVQEITKLAQKTEMPFLMQSAYCKGRKKNHPQTPCKDCESRVMCLIGTHLNRQKKIMDEMTCINCANETKIHFMTLAMIALQEENKSLKQGANHDKAKQG
jgi:hypothetical protein